MVVLNNSVKNFGYGSLIGIGSLASVGFSLASVSILNSRFSKFKFYGVKENQISLPNYSKNSNMKNIFLTISTLMIPILVACACIKTHSNLSKYLFQQDITKSTIYAHVSIAVVISSFFLTIFYNPKEWELF